MLILKKPTKTEPIYVLSFKEYLQPKQPRKCTPLQQFKTASGVQQQQPKRKWTAKVKPKTPIPTTAFTSKLQPTSTPISKQKCASNKWKNLLVRWQEKRGIESAQEDEPVLEFAPCTWQSLLGKLPNVLAFLRARNDDGMCKRKTGFEIYCEMASFHGFANFVGATTWQRALWFIIICMAIAMSVMVLVMSHLLNVGSPTVIYTESTTHPSWSIPYPAISICSVNRISKRNAVAVAERLIAGTHETQEEVMRLLKLLQYEELMQYDNHTTDLQLLQRLIAAKNITLAQLQRELQPRCLCDNGDLLRCMWQGEAVDCAKLWREHQTPQGRCCVFNFDGNDGQTPNCCGRDTGHTLLLRPQRTDYMGSLYASRIAYQIFIHEPHTVADERLLAPELIAARTENSLSVRPRQTYTTSYVRGESVHLRRCQFADERPLRTFQLYSQSNCLAECWSTRAYAQCGCIPANWPRPRQYWRFCQPTQMPCIAAGRANFTRMLTSDLSTNYRYDHYAEQFNCNCWPTCEYNRYFTQLDTLALQRTEYTHNDEQLFDGIQLDEHILLHIYYDDIIAERLRVDVYENWLSFVGTFGGITGLFMGYSVVSAFEMIFFVFVRPACNWLTKKQIRYRVKRKQRQRERERERERATAAAATTTAKSQN